MFGKGGTLNAWLKEFFQLVFIQTLQAFIYCIIIIVIVRLYSTAQTAQATPENEDYASGLGLFSVLALISVFKVEDIVRRIFGFGSTKADHGSAVKSIAKTAFAMQLGKRVLNNGKQMIGGAKNMLDANKDAKKAANRLEARKRAYYKDNNIKEGEEGGGPSAPTRSAGSSGSNASTSTMPAQRKIDSRKRDEKLRLFAAAQKARKMAQTETDPAKKKALMEQAKQKLAQSKAIDDTFKDNSSSGIGASLESPSPITEFSGPSRAVGTSSGSAVSVSTPVASSASIGDSVASSNENQGKPKDYHQKMLSLQEEYEKELANAKKKRKEGFRTMTKGAVESVGAVIGGTAGGILGFADGDIDGGINGIMSGAGLGDAAGAGITNAAFGTKDLIEGAANTTGKALKDYSTGIKEQYEAEKKNAEAQMRELNKQAESEVKRMNKSAEKARDNLEKQVNSSAAQTAKNITKAVGKGAVKTYNSRHGGIRQLDAGLNDLKNHIKTSTNQIKLDSNVESID